MAIIYNIDDHRRKKAQKHHETELEQRIAKMVFGRWESEEEQMRYMLEQADKDLEELEVLYPIPDEAVDW